MQASPADGSYDGGPLMMHHPAEWSQRRVEILGDFYARNKNLSLISARDDYDGLELAQLGYKPVENDETEVQQQRSCSVCHNLPNLHHRVCNCTGSVMRNFLQNAIHSRRHQNDFYFGMVPYNRSTAEVRAREFGFVHRPQIEKRERLGNEINLDYHNVQLGMKRKEFKGTYATVEIRQNMWSYRKRGNEYGESSNTERRAICARRPTLKPIDMRKRRFGRGEYEMTMELGTRRYQKPIGNKNPLAKRTRFKEDVEIMGDKIIEENNDLSEPGHKYFGSPAIEDVSDSHSCHNSNDGNDVSEISTKRDLENKVKQLYEYILSLDSPRVEIEYKKPEDNQDNFDTINSQQDAKKLPSERKSSGLKRHVKKGIYRKVEVVLKRPRTKIDEGCLREYIEMQKRMNELMNRMLKEEDKNEEYDDNQEECEAVSVDEGISPNTIPKRSHLKVHLQSFFTEEDENANDMHKDSAPNIPDFPRVDENFPLKVNKKLTVLSGDNTADETNYTKETHTKADKDSVCSSVPDSTENKSRRRTVRHLVPIQVSAKPNSEKNSRPLSSAYGQSKSLPPSPTPSKAVMRRQVKCILRRSPPGTSLRRVDTRRSHQTHTVARKVVSRSELISHSEHTGHYYATQDSMLPFKPICNKKKGTSLPNSACENNSGVFRSLQSRSFSSSVKISRLERGLSYRTMGNSDLEEILSPKREQSRNLEDIPFRGHTGGIFNSPLFSTKDDIIWNATKSKSNAYKGNKGLVLETFKDVLEYIQEQKPPDDNFRADVVHNTPSSYSVSDQRCKTYSPGCQVLESFFDLIKYLRQIKAASQLPCSRYHTTDHGVAPNPEGDAKEYSRTPFKFTSKRKHDSVCDRGSLVLEAFREVLKLMKEEEYIQIPTIHCKSTESAFPPKTDKNFLFFELHNGKLFSDSKLDSSQKCSSETPCQSPTLSCENNHNLKSNELESETSMVSNEKLPVMNKSLRKQGRREMKESNLRNFFSHPLFDDMKRALKEGTLTRNKHEKIASKKRERKNKVKYDDIKNVPDDTKTVNAKTTNKIMKSKHRMDVHKRFSKENSGSNHTSITNIKTGVQVTEKHIESKEDLIQNKTKESKESIESKDSKDSEDSKEENKVETNIIDKKSTTRLNHFSKPNLRGAADGEACGPSNANILIRFDEKCKLVDDLGEFGGTSKEHKTSVAYGESDGPSNAKSLPGLSEKQKLDESGGPSNSKSLPRFDEKFKSNATGSKFCCPSTSQMFTGIDEKCKLGVVEGEFCIPSNTKSYSTFDEKHKSGTTHEESFCRNYVKSLTRVHRKCELAAAGNESCKPRKMKNVSNHGEKCKLGIAENELCATNNLNISSRLHEKCTSRTADGESRSPSNVQSLPSFDKNCKSGPTCGEPRASRNAKIDTTIDGKSQLGTKCGVTSSSSNAQTSFLLKSGATGGKCSGSNQGKTFCRLGKNTSRVENGESWSPSNVKSLCRFEEYNKSGTDIAKSCGRSTKSLTVVDNKSKSGVTDGESCVSIHSKTKCTEKKKSKPRIPPENDKNEISIKTDDPLFSKTSLKTPNSSTETFPSSSKYSCNKDLSMGKKSQREPLNKDCPPKKMQRNVKALEKMASGRYCHSRRRADVEGEEEEQTEK